MCSCVQRELTVPGSPLRQNRGAAPSADLAVRDPLLLPSHVHTRIYTLPPVVGDLISNDESPAPRSEDRSEELNGIGKRRWLIFDPSSLRRPFAISNETTQTLTLSGFIRLCAR